MDITAYQKTGSQVQGNSITQLGCDLLNKIIPNQNVVFSPLSIFSCLAMTYAGAQSITAQQIENVLHIENNDQMTHALIKDVFHDIKNREDRHTCIFKFANTLFCCKQYSLLPQFLSLVEEYYEAKPQSVDFTNSIKTAKQINSWVEKQTYNKINDLIPASGINPLTKLILVNALYFKGDWKHKFNRDLTKPMDFKIDNRNKFEVQMMSITKNFNYMEDTDIGLQMVELPYICNNLSMYILLPKSVNGIDSLCKEMNSKTIVKWVSKMSRDYKVNLSLPRFKMTYQTALSDLLGNLGMIDAFDNKNADFSKMCSDNDLYITEIFHKVFIEVNERGTEAAAATGAVARYKTRSKRPPLIKVMTVDHPFVFMMYHKSSGSTLFLGKMYNPAINPSVR
ncbi:Serpin B10 [Trichoplax sp. H2]|nr:Serpin B10 [Trichoplax sp. H2]|eukprot:RDD41304.1 Serpin B10 [Trichoplax sp. H2]